MSSVTIKQIAKLAGVSTTAVSFVLNGKKGVSDETRERVLKVIKEADYTPNLNSRRLILKRSFNIIVALNPDFSNLDNLFYTAILKSIVKRGGDLGYNIVLSLNPSEFKDSLIADSLNQRNVDGIIFFQDVISEIRYNVEKFKIPFVIVDSQLLKPTYPCIWSDYELSSYTGTNYLISQGHKKIGFIGMKAIPDFYLRTFNGYKRALSSANLPVQMDWIQSEAYDADSAGACMKNMLSCPERPTAIMCAADMYAIGAMNYLINKGYSVPGDFSFCGIDDVIVSRYFCPPLTTIRIDKSQMGILAVELLDGLINHERMNTLVVIKSDDLAVRGSVKRIS